MQILGYLYTEKFPWRLWTFLQSFSFIFLMASGEMTFYFFAFSISVAMATNQIQWFGKKSCLVEDYSRNISEKLLSKYLQWDRNKGLLSLFHYKSVENISCHSYESTWATAIKKKKIVEANVMNISTKFQLHPPYGFWEKDFWLFCFANLAFWLPWQPIKFSGLDKIHTVGRGLLKKHFHLPFVQISAVKQQ